MNEKTPPSPPKPARATAVTQVPLPPPAPESPLAVPAPAPVPAATRDWERILLYAAIIVFAGLFVAAQGFHGTWLWDDDQEITNNFALRSTTGLKEIWKGNVGADYLPIKTTIIWLQYQFWEQDNVAYHVINAIWHVLNGLLIWHLFWRMRIKWAWLGGLLFVTHPVLVESVAWVSEQKNTISLLFMLLSAIFYLNYEDWNENRSPSNGLSSDIALIFKPGSLAWSILFFALALMSKSAVVIFPFAIVLYKWWRDDKLELRDTVIFAALGLFCAAVACCTIMIMSVAVNVDGLGGATGPGDKSWLIRLIVARRATTNFFAYMVLALIISGGLAYLWNMIKSPRWRDVLHLVLTSVPYFAMVTAVSIVTVYFQHKNAIGAEIIPVGGFWSRAVIAGYSVFFYLKQCVWPFELMDFGNSAEMSGKASLPWVGLVLALSALLYWGYRRGRERAGILFFGGLTVLCLFLTQCVWPFDWPFGAYGLVPIYPRWVVPENPSAWMLLPWVAFALLILLFWRYRGGWGRDAILGLGFFFGFLVPVLGFIDMSYMRITWVADHFLYIPVIGVIALIVAGAARLHEIIPAGGKPWARGVGMAALFLVAWNASFYSDIFLNETNMWRYTLSKNRDAWQAHSRYGKVLLDSNQRDAAFYHIQNSNRLRPDLAETNNNMGVLLLQKGRSSEALPYFKEAVRLMPIGAFLLNYANALTQVGQGGEAAVHYEKLLVGDSNNPILLTNYGVALLQGNRREDAIRALRRALELNPNLQDARRNLEIAEKAQGLSGTGGPAIINPSMPSPGLLMPQQPLIQPPQLQPQIPAIFQQNQSQ